MPLLTTPTIYKGWQTGIGGLFPTTVTTSDLDTFLDIVCTEIDTEIRNELNRFVIEQRSNIVEFANGTGTPWLTLRCTPIQSIAEVRVAQNSPGGDWGQAVPSGFDTTTILPVGSYAFEIDDPINGWGRAGRLVRLNGGVWPGLFYTPYYRLSTKQTDGYGNVQVTYTAGLTNDPMKIPADLQLAANLLISQIRMTRLFGFLLTAEGLAEYHYSLSPLIKGMLQVGTVAAILAKYKVLPI